MWLLLVLHFVYWTVGVCTFVLCSSDNHLCYFFLFIIQAVVVRRTPLTGIPNEKTEELLCQYPFRRNSHRFCSPGYCRCFDPSPDEFNSSRFSGLQEVGLLESTGEGVHLYDLAHRLLEPGGCGKPWSSIAFVRVRGELPGRNDSTKINPFIEKIWGGIYTVRKDELKHAISYSGRYENNHQSTTEPADEPSLSSTNSCHRQDTFCAALVLRFYKHMGWVDGDRAVNSVMRKYRTSFSFGVFII